MLFAFNDTVTQQKLGCDLAIQSMPCMHADLGLILANAKTININTMEGILDKNFAPPGASIQEEIKTNKRL